MDGSFGDIGRGVPPNVLFQKFSRFQSKDVLSHLRRCPAAPWWMRKK